MFGNVHVHVQKRAGDQYQCNERENDSDSFQCPVTKLILIMQNYIFSIVLIQEVELSPIKLKLNTCQVLVEKILVEKICLNNVSASACKLQTK